MVVYLTKNLKNSIKKVFSAYCYEIMPNVYVSKYHAGLHDRIIDFVKKNIKNGQTVLFIRKDNSLEGFVEECIGNISKAKDFEGVKLYKKL